MTNDPSFSPSMKMAELLERDSSLLGVFARMGLTFGYGDATVPRRSICALRNSIRMKWC